MWDLIISVLDHCLSFYFDPSLRWAHSHFVGFVMSRLSSSKLPLGFHHR